MPNVVLIIDDAPDVARALRRHLALTFDKAEIATSSADAEAKLAAADPKVTHLVCDYLLGEEAVTGVELIPRLRAAHPEIRRAALVTGSASAGAPSPGIDGVFGKPCDIKELSSFLRNG